MATSKILIVDDEPFNVDYLEQELEELNYETVSASNGQEALNRVKTELPDLVLLDIMMPVMDGFEVLSHLKANPSTRDIPVIVISANSDLQSVVHGIELGAEDYLPKPFEPALLHARILSSLEKKRLRDVEQLYLKGLEHEMDIARNIQKGFLPSRLPNALGWEIAEYFKAAKEVAGDFYDAFLLPEGDLVCVVGDVCDKGVGAALFMTLFRSLIRVTCTSGVFSSGAGGNTLAPGERLQHVVSFTNNYIVETHGDANMFATLFVGIFDQKQGRLTYVNCGNESPLLFQCGEVVKTLKPTGPVVGIFSDPDFRVEEIEIKIGDLLVIYTDGIPDARDEKNDSFGHERLLHLGKGSTGMKSKLVIENIVDQLRQFTGVTDQFDDITLMAVKRCL